MRVRKEEGANVPSGEGVCAFEVELVAFLHEPLAVTPFVDTILQMRVKDLHS